LAEKRLRVKGKFVKGEFLDHESESIFGGPKMIFKTIKDTSV